MMKKKEFKEGFKSFAEEVKERVRVEIGDDFEVKILEYEKVNYSTLQMIILKDPNTSSNIVTPVIDLIGYYHDYIKHGKIIFESVLESARIMKSSILNADIDIDFPLNIEYQNMRNNIVPQLVNTKLCKSLLKNVPSFEFLDLSIIFRCVTGQGSFIVRNDMLKYWNISKEKLKENVNILKDDISFKRMSELLKGTTRKTKGVKDFDELDYMNSNINIFVLSNKQNRFGATCILDDKILERISYEMRGDFLIIPSSVDEVIIAPMGYGGSSEELNNIIREVNFTYVEEDKILSDHFYVYSSEEKTIKY